MDRPLAMHLSAGRNQSEAGIEAAPRYGSQLAYLRIQLWRYRCIAPGGLQSEPPAGMRMERLVVFTEIHRP